MLFRSPDEVGGDMLYARFTRPTMVDGVIKFERPEKCEVKKAVRTMSIKSFDLEKNQKSAGAEIDELEIQA